MKVTTTKSKQLLIVITAAIVVMVSMLVWQYSLYQRISDNQDSCGLGETRICSENYCPPTAICIKGIPICRCSPWLSPLFDFLFKPTKSWDV